jgi:nucleotide-binding universal stress UspA family protein
MKTSFETAPDAQPGSIPEPVRAAEIHQHPHRAVTAAQLFRRILVPIDFSPSSVKTLDFAIALAEPLKATLILLHIVEPQGNPEKFLTPGGAMDESTRQELESARERLAALYHKKHAKHVAADTLVRMGRAYSEICDTAKALAVNLIVIGTHGSRHTSLGSTAERVVKQAACPVVTVPLDLC